FEEVGPEIDLNIKVSRSLGAVIADPLAVERILIALISNALKFGGAKPRVAIAVGLTSDGAPFVSVRDWGLGIDERDSEKIFEPFYQGDVNLQAGSKGAGLGLTIGRRLAQANGGDLIIKSRPQVGTVATLVLPAENHVAKSGRQKDEDLSEADIALSAAS
ncbi:MAG: ATP-binding protein, partial [Pseudomonadota bacterium]